MGADSGGKMLEGVTVVDLTTFVTGGFATLMLANQGAEVIKVERPDVGDDSRHSGPPFVDVSDYDGPGRSASPHGESPYFWTVNYDKKSIELDLKTEEGGAICRELIAEADVVVENFRPGTADRLGLGYEDLRGDHPDLIYCSISAFGETGPWSERPGYDLLVQGMSGIMSITGSEGSGPTKVGLPQTDLITAMWAAFGVVTALYRRERTGEGERVELGMLDATLPWLTKQGAKAFVGEEPEQMGTKDPVLAPYQSYPTADGYLNVACANQKLWTALCEEIGREDLVSDPRFESNADRVEHMEELEEELSETFRERTTDAWVEQLAEGAALPVGPVYGVSEALESEQVVARGVVDTVAHPAAGDIEVLEHPLHFERAESGFESGPPLLGEDTVRILKRLGRSDEDIEALRATGAIPES